MIKRLFVSVLIVMGLGGGATYIGLGAPDASQTRNLFPATDSVYEIGTTSKAYLRGYFDNLCLGGDCQSSWAAGSFPDYLSQVGDVSTTTLANGSILTYETGTGWVSAATSTLNITAPITGGTAGMLTSWVDATTLTATSAPTAAYYTATSTTASTFPYASTTAVTASMFWGPLTGNVTGTASGNDILGQATSTLTSHTTTYNHANYDTAYGWGDHASAGYITASTTQLTASGNIWAASFVGPLAGNALTATALGANGSNCSAGQAPLGVDASGAVESCFDVWTESENTAAGYQTAANVYSIVGGTTTLPNLNTLTGLGNIGSSSATTTFAGYVTSTAFGIVGKFFASATQFVVSVAANFTAGLTVLDFLDIPSATDPTVNAEGEIAINTTAASSSIRYFDGTAERALTPDWQKTLKVSTTTILALNGNPAASTTVKLDRTILHPITHTARYCETTTGTWGYIIGNGTASSSYVHCSTTGATQTSLTNATFPLNTDIYIEIGPPSSNATVGTLIIGGRYDAD